MTDCYFEKDIETVVSVYQGFLSFEDFKRNALLSIEMRKERKCKKELVDAEKLEVMVKEIQNWINEYWFPTSEEYGLRYMAFVQPKNIFGELSVRATNAASEMKGNVEIAYFQDIEEAKEWLRNK